MIFLIDVDGVVANFVDYLDEIVKTGVRTENCTEWDVFSLMSGHREDAARMILRSPEFWQTQPAIYGAPYAIDKIHSNGHKVCFVSSPYGSCRQWMDAREQWLDSFFRSCDYDVIYTANKHYIRGDVFIDDKPENVREWKMKNPGRALLFEAPYNQGNEDLERFNWDMLGKLL